MCMRRLLIAAARASSQTPTLAAARPGPPRKGEGDAYSAAWRVTPIFGASSPAV